MVCVYIYLDLFNILGYYICFDIYIYIVLGYYIFYRMNDYIYIYISYFSYINISESYWDVIYIYIMLGYYIGFWLIPFSFLTKKRVLLPSGAWPGCYLAWKT